MSLRAAYNLTGKVRAGGGVGAGSAGGGGSASSGWNPADIATGMSVSGTNNSVLTLDPVLSTKSGRGVTGHSVSGVWYFEATLAGTLANDIAVIGVSRSVFDINAGTIIGNDATGYSCGMPAYNGFVNMFNYPYFNTGAYPVGTVVGIKLDCTGGSITFYKNGVSAATLSRAEFSSNVWYPTGGQNAAAARTGATWTLNTGSPLYLPSGASVWG